MIKNLESFRLDLQRFHEVVIPETCLQYQKRMVVKLFQGIVFRNSQMSNHPVDTGWARANWSVSLGTAGRGTIGAYPGRGISANLPIFDFASILAAARPFGIVWIYNNVPYIGALENGHSKQAPTGMVEGALNDLQTFVDGF